MGVDGDAISNGLFSGVEIKGTGADETNPGVSVQAVRIVKHPNRKKSGITK